MNKLIDQLMRMVVLEREKIVAEMKSESRAQEMVKKAISKITRLKRIESTLADIKTLCDVDD